MFPQKRPRDQDWRAEVCAGGDPRSGQGGLVGKLGRKETRTERAKEWARLRITGPPSHLGVPGPWMGPTPGGRSKEVKRLCSICQLPSQH